MVIARFTGFLGRKCVSRRKEGVWGLETLKLSPSTLGQTRMEVADGARLPMRESSEGKIFQEL
jgi:hypothetical protein